tara:strand:- start:713 stop:1027 length:315 start_codon:yes stop_codon:yes gene_type:complete
MEQTETKQYERNPTLDETVEPSNDLKNMLVEYVGEKLNPQDMNVTVEMVIEVVAEEFPEFVWALAEENWVRGYEQALDDVDTGMKLAEEEKNDKQKRSCKLCEE